MAHNASKVVMGTVKTSSREVTEHVASPSTFKAGLAVRQKSDGDLTLTASQGKWLGVSLGKGLSDSLKTTAVARDGLGVPVLLEAAPARQTVTITDYSHLITGGDDTLKIGATTFTFKGSPSGENQVGAVTSNNQTATNLAAKINGHSVAGLLFKAVATGADVLITALDNSTLGSSIDCVYTDNGSSTVGLTVAGGAVAFVGGGSASADYVSIGSKVYFSDTTGKADDSNSGATISDAIYVSGVKTAIQEDGTEVACALVDMPGGL